MITVLLHFLTQEKLHTLCFIKAMPVPCLSDPWGEILALLKAGASYQSLETKSDMQCHGRGKLYKAGAQMGSACK